MITDSGGIQEEAPSLGKPVLVARESTERAEGVDAGTLRLVGTDADRIVDEARAAARRPGRLRRDGRRPRNPYGDGHAAERIVAALEHVSLGGDPPAPFGSGYTRWPRSSSAVGLDAARRRRLAGATSRPGALGGARSTAASDR